MSSFNWHILITPELKNKITLFWVAGKCICAWLPQEVCCSVIANKSEPKSPDDLYVMYVINIWVAGDETNSAGLSFYNASLRLIAAMNEAVYSKHCTVPWDFIKYCTVSKFVYCSSLLLVFRRFLVAFQDPAQRLLIRKLKSGLDVH